MCLFNWHVHLFLCKAKECVLHKWGVVSTTRISNQNINICFISEWKCWEKSPLCPVLPALETPWKNGSYSNSETKDLPFQMGHMEYALSKKKKTNKQNKCGTSANLSRSAPNSWACNKPKTSLPTHVFSRGETEGEIFLHMICYFDMKFYFAYGSASWFLYYFFAVTKAATAICWRVTLKGLVALHGVIDWPVINSTNIWLL